MNFNLAQWLFTDPCSAGGGPASGNADCPNPEQFHFYAIWLALCIGFLVIWGYYQIEGRRRLFSGHAINKRVFDNVTSNYAIIGVVGLIIVAFRWAADSSLFA